jgi:hypothetical protein
MSYRKRHSLVGSMQQVNTGEGGTLLLTQTPESWDTKFPTEPALDHRRSCFVSRQTTIAT